VTIESHGYTSIGSVGLVSFRRITPALDDLVALKVVFKSGETRYYLTYGRVHDAVDPRPIERAVRRYVDRPTRRVASVELCDTLAAASGAGAPRIRRRT
jgi:hypothetical protein